VRAPGAAVGLSWRRQGWLLALVALALLHIALGLAGLGASFAGVGFPRSSRTPDAWRLCIIAAFSGLGVYLVAVARRDVRAAYLGALFVLIAAFFAHDPIEALARALPAAAAHAVRTLRALPVEAFLPVFAWLFARDFPHALGSRGASALARAATVASVAVAAVLVVENVLAAAGQPLRGLGGERADPFGVFPLAVFGLTLPVMPFVLWRTRHAPADEARRVRLFASALVFFGLPAVLLAVVPPVVPGLPALVRGDFSQRVVVPFVQVMLLAMAAATTYAVAVEHVLDVRTTVRKAAQYSAARIAVAALAGAPFGWASWVVFEARHEPAAALLGGARSLRLLVPVALGAFAFRLRRRVMLGVDRLFFRESYDPQTVLADVTARARAADSLEEIAVSLRDELDRALHLDGFELLYAAPDAQGDFLPILGALRPLPVTSALPERLAGSRRPVVVALERSEGLSADLPLADRQWLADAAAHALVPLARSGSGLCAFLVVGRKQSELPFSREDLLLFETLAAAVGGVVETQLRCAAERVRPAAGRASRETVAECRDCGSLQPPAGGARDGCTACGGGLRAAALPREPFGRFRLDRRLGEGAMGIVYLATDLELARPVALKTLPVTQPEDAGRLRREARAMAAVSHPNLALIHGLESWKGTPVLVMEYLAGGTLGERIGGERLPAAQMRACAAAIARALACVHGAGLLHRDVKPSNIGFAADGAPKLLDFGLVQIASRYAGGALSDAGIDAPSGRTGLAGTPLYMSPEALALGPPEPGFDLWSLAVVAYEALTGVHPFERADWAQTLGAIRAGWTDALAPPLAGTDGAAEFFADALARDRSRRPRSAAALALALDDTKAAAA